MARIPELKRDELNAEQRRVGEIIYADRGNNYDGPYAVLLRNPELAERANQLGIYLRDGTSLARPLSELAILITARQWNAQFEWHVHENIARKAGLSDQVLAAIKNRQQPEFDTPDQEIVYDYVTELYAKREVSDAVHDRAVELLGEEGIVELVSVTGFYSMVAMTCNAFQPHLPDGKLPPLPA